MKYSNDEVRITFDDMIKEIESVWKWEPVPPSSVHHRPALRTATVPVTKNKLSTADILAGIRAGIRAKKAAATGKTKMVVIIEDMEDA